MILYRLSRKKHAKVLDGVGAKLYPGRWNSLDVPMIYCADTIPQCMVEVLVHLEESPDDYCSVELIVPDDVGIVQPDPKKLPKEWRDDDYNASTRAVGDAFVADNGHLLMRLPSAAVPGGFNYVMNPLHPDIKRVKVGKVKPFKFDQRLFKKK
jgi:RES domain-containing protein